MGQPHEICTKLARCPQILSTHCNQRVSLEMEGCPSTSTASSIFIPKKYYLFSGSCLAALQESHLTRTQPTRFSPHMYSRWPKHRQTQAHYRFKQTEQLYRLSHASHDNTPAWGRFSIYLYLPAWGGALDLQGRWLVHIPIYLIFTATSPFIIRTICISSRRTLLV